MTWGMTAVAGATLVTGYMGAQAAKGAAQTQSDAAGRAMENERAMYEQSREDLAPYRESGYTALKDIEGMKPFLTSQFGPDQFAQYLDPSMAFRQKIGTQTTERMANVGGGALSGNTLRALTDYGQNLASTEYGNAFNRFQTERGNIYNTLANIAGMGQGAVNTGVNAGQNFAASQTGLTTGSAAAQAAGTVGAANAIGGAATNFGNMAYLNTLLNKKPVEQGPVQLSGPA
ncbi:MAG: hypothetical protein AN484_19840 [Aphanizomenon flos-aquae WA102]|uniref:DNA transfer protein p32 n=1 Tax=Aphanizomenon flos-aquae WA102 TaxID=1710896 RepID=A0A1B7WY03_APHFL|nr:MAG: hypothetical protein AN484_19840 [Aphanizomenon flos-aquae WA102]